MEDDVCLDPLRENGRRKEDHSFLARLANIAIKYHWLATLFLMIFWALGFGLETPAKLFAEVRASIEAVKTDVKINKILADSAVQQLKAADTQSDKERGYLKDLLELSVIAQCKTMPKAATQYLPCRRLYNERGIE